MILYHNLNFFDKNGKKLNLEKIQYVTATVNRNDDTVFDYEDAVVEVLTNVYGYIEKFNIVKTGTKYTDKTTINISDSETGVSYVIDTAEYLTFGPNGEILDITLPSPVHGFGYPSIVYEGNMFFQKISTGLFESSQIYLLEEMVDNETGDSVYSSPRTYIDNFGSTTSELKAKFTTDDDAELSLFNVNYTDDKYPFIEKIDESVITLDDGTEDELINANRQVTLLRSNAVNFNLYAKSDVEGIFERTLVIYETVEDNDYIIATINFRAEIEGEDERLKSMLDNFGIQMNLQELKLFRDSDVNEELPNYLLLNQKRKEMLLEYHNIFPYIGSYKALVNIINYFGYGDTRLKEYWLNVKKTNTLKKVSKTVSSTSVPIDLTSLHSFGNAFKPMPLLNRLTKTGTVSDTSTPSFKDSNSEITQSAATVDTKDSVDTYNVAQAIKSGIFLPEQQTELIKNINEQHFKQIEVPMQLAQKGKHWQSEEMIPNKVWKKTNLFGLFYDIVKETGDYDQYGTPITEDAFLFSEDEVLLKLFGLREYLKEKFMPLNARIIDIVGEGVYFERWATNIWKDDTLNIVVSKNEVIDFEVDNEEGLILDLQEYGVVTAPPESGDNIADFKNVFINNLMPDPALFENDNGPVGCRTELTMDDFVITWDEMDCTWDELQSDTRSVRRATMADGDFTIDPVNNIIKLNYTRKNNEIVGGFTEIILHSTVGTPPVDITQTLKVLEVNPFVHNIVSFPFGTAWADMNFLSQNEGWIVDGAQGRAYKTIDGGRNWTQKHNSAGWIEAVDFTDTLYGWVAGDNIAAYTEDGGDTWNTINLPWSAVDSWARDVEILTEDHIVISGHNITATTLNKGVDWTVSSTVMYETYDMKFINESIGFQVGEDESGVGKVAKTIDGGLTWTIIYSSDSNNFRSVHFFNENEGVLAGKRKLYRTVDGGENWDEVFMWYNGSYGRNFNFINDQIGYVSGENGFLAKTSNGGLFWEIIQTETTETINVVQYYDEDHGHWLFGNDTGKFWYGIDDTILVLSDGDLTLLENAWIEYVYFKNNLVTHTWDTIAQGENYEVEWIIKYENAERFTYNVRGNINIYKSITVDLPFAGSYTATCVMYDLTNHSVRKTKTIDVEMPIVDFMCFGRSINPVTTWDESTDVTWDDLNTEWRQSAITNDVTWDDLDGLSWDDLDFERYQEQDDPFIQTNRYKILKISEYDRYVGNLSYADWDDSKLYIEGQNLLPALRPASSDIPQDYIYVRSGEIIKRVGVLDVTYDNDENQTIVTTETLPRGIDKSWDVLREIGKRVLFENDTTAETNTDEGIAVGQYITFKKLYEKYKKTNISITDGIYNSNNELEGIVIDTPIHKIENEYGRIYKTRTLSISNIANINTELKYIDFYTGFTENEVIPGYTIFNVSCDVNGNTIEQRLLVTKFEVVGVANVNRFYFRELDNDMGMLMYATLPITITYDFYPFVVKLRHFINSSETSNQVYFNFNDYPTNNYFNDIIEAEPDLISDWKFDYIIKDGEFAIEITNVGVEDGNTLVTFNDPNSELYRVSPTFTASCIVFDEDYADRRFGTNIFTWQNMDEITWDEMDHLTWNMTEYRKAPLCEFKINSVMPGGTIQFNEMDLFQFVDTPPISSFVDKLTQLTKATEELNASENAAISRFRYTVIETDDDCYIAAIAKSEGMFYLGYLKFAGGVVGEHADPSKSHTFPIGVWQDWNNPYIYGPDNQYAPWNPVARAYYEFGYDYTDNRGWYPAEQVDDNGDRIMFETVKNDYLYYDPIDKKDTIYAKFPSLLNSVEWRFDEAYRLLYDYALVSPFAWNDIIASVNATEIKKMTTLFFKPRNKKVAGKKFYKWIITNYEDDTIECVVTKPFLIWTFSKDGVYNVSLEITDVNKNVTSNVKQGYITVN